METSTPTWWEPGSSTATVEFDHDADTFVRDVVFIFEDNRLTAARTLDATSVRVVLEKQ